MELQLAARERESERTAERREDRQVDERDALLMLLGIDAVYGATVEDSPGTDMETAPDAADPW